MLLFVASNYANAQRALSRKPLVVFRQHAVVRCQRQPALVAEARIADAPVLLQERALVVERLMRLWETRQYIVV